MQHQQGEDGMASGTRALIRRIRRDIVLFGEDRVFCALWRDISARDKRLVDYCPSNEVNARPADVTEHYDAMPAWQILRELLAQNDAAKIF